MDELDEADVIESIEIAVPALVKPLVSVEEAVLLPFFEHPDSASVRTKVAKKIFAMKTLS
jgi:hypothetical protein